MPTPTLQQVAEAVIRRAQRQGYVVPSEVRSELRLAGLEEARWKDAVELGRASLIYKQGRYYHKAAVSPRLEHVLGVNAFYAPTPEIIAKRTGWKALTAVRNGDIRSVNDTEITRPGPRLAIGLRNLALAMYPDLILPAS